MSGTIAAKVLTPELNIWHAEAHGAIAAERCDPTKEKRVIAQVRFSGVALSDLVGRNTPFVSVNCAALAPSLISSELFGHEKGAFTGATRRRLGRFELANGGTIFLDEIGEVQQVLARYVRGTDARDGAAVAAVFTEAGRVEISYNNSGKLEPLGELVGRETIAAAVSQMMKPYPPRGWSHHTTHDHIIDINGDDATLDAQFVVFEVRGNERPAAGWPEGAFWAQGTVQPIEAGYYRPILRRVDGVWKITTMRITLNIPYAFPGQ